MGGIKYAITEHMDMLGFDNYMKWV